MGSYIFPGHLSQSEHNATGNRSRLYTIQQSNTNHYATVTFPITPVSTDSEW